MRLTSRSTIACAVVAVFAPASLHCSSTTNIFQNAAAADAGDDRGGDRVSADPLCAKLASLGCGQSSAECIQNFAACTGNEADKRTLIACMETASFTCRGRLPTTSSCAAELTRACPSPGTVVPEEEGADASRLPSSICDGLCEAGVTSTFSCVTEAGAKYTIELTPGRDAQGVPLCRWVDNQYGFYCNQTIWTFAGGFQDGSWTFTGGTLRATYGSGVTATCTKL
jgi:hypothetical protein